MKTEEIISSNNNTNTSKQDINNIENINCFSELFDGYNHDNELDEDTIIYSKLYFNKQEKNKDEYKSKPTIENQSISNDSKDTKNKILNIKRNRSKQKNNISDNDNFNENKNQIKNVIKSDLIYNSLPQKITNNEITKNKDEGNMLESVKSKIFQALPKIFGLEKIGDNIFIKSLKDKEWKDFEELKKELVEIKEKNKEAFDLVKETPWKTFENVFTKINKEGFDYNVDKGTINKFIKLINFFSSEKAPNTINEEKYQNLDVILNNNENEDSCDKLDSNDLYTHKKNVKKKNEASKKNNKKIYSNETSTKTDTKNQSKYKIIQKMNRKDNLYYLLKFALIDSFLNNFNDIDKSIRQSIIKRLSKSQETDFMNNDFTDIVEEYKLSDKIKNNKVKDLIKLPKKEFLKRMVSDGKFFTEDEKKQKNNYENSKCRNLAYELFETNNLEGLILLTKLIKLDKKKDKEGNDKEYIKILNAKNFEIAINLLKGYEDFKLDLFSNEKYEINNRIINMWIIANFPIEYLENNKSGSKKTEKKEK